MYLVNYILYVFDINAHTVISEFNVYDLSLHTEIISKLAFSKYKRRWNARRIKWQVGSLWLKKLPMYGYFCGQKECKESA